MQFERIHEAMLSQSDETQHNPIRFVAMTGARTIGVEDGAGQVMMVLPIGNAE